MKKPLNLFVIGLFLFYSISLKLIANNLHQNEKVASNNLTHQKSNLTLIKNHYQFNLLNQDLSQKKTNIIESDESKDVSYKSPWLAFGLALMTLPGAGQIYNGEYGKLAIMYGVAIFGAILFTGTFYFSNYSTSEPEPAYFVPLAATGFCITMGAWLWSIIDAPISANRINERNTHQKSLEIVSYAANKCTLSLNYNKTLSNYMLKVNFNF